MPKPAESHAYSYIRFSLTVQAQGDSLRRQAESAADWCARNGITLDTSLTFRDLGKSAYLGKHRENPDRHALAGFLKLVESGKVPRGSYLIVENLDRLTREHIRPALTLLLNLIEAGIRVVQLKPVEQVYDEDVEPMQLMMAIMELSRGHSESAIKSERVGKAWAEKKRKARDDKEVATLRVPGWIEKRDGKLCLIPDAAATVRRIYLMAIAGHGSGVIAKRLNMEKVPPIGRADYWARSFVVKILTERTAMGEYQPHSIRTGKRVPDGDPIPNYYPAVVSEAEWHTARAARVSRKLRGGRPNAGKVSLLTSLVRSALDGGNMHIIDKGKKGVGPQLTPYMATNGVKGSNRATFQYEAFEAAILSCLREIDPATVLGDETGRDEVNTLAGELETIEAEIVKLADSLDRNGHSDTLERSIRKKEARKNELIPLLNEARRKAESPLSEAWGTCQSLISTLESAPDQTDARIRLRSALRSIVDEIWVLIVPRGVKHRLAAVQIWFRGGTCRNYLIIHTRGHGGAIGKPRKAQWETRSLTEDQAIDLRNRDHAERLAKVLSETNIGGAQ